MTEQERLAARLRECREYLGFSQQEVADHLGLHRPAVSEIEAGRRGVSSRALTKLARLYQRPTGYFLGDEPPPSAELERLLGPLEATDRAEVLRFAEFLAWRKRPKE